MSFLPMSYEEMRDRGWRQLDYILITGDAYVDHPSFGTAIISRVIEAQGFRIGIIAQPDIREKNDFLKLGIPKYAYFVNSGNLDSMVAHYTVAKRRRRIDKYSPGDKIGLRPDRAIIEYCRVLHRLKETKQIPVIIGGLEASLRRFAHYDYWADTVFPSILYSSGADLLVYGMGERQTAEIVQRLAANESIHTIKDVRGTCYLTEPKYTPFGCKECASFTQVAASKESYARAYKIQYLQQDEVYGKPIVQRQKEKMLVQNSPMPALSQEELDRTFALPYMRSYHPSYKKYGGVSALHEVEFSIMHNRGCFGNCNFCAITFHQGRRVTSRSMESILNEALLFKKSPNFKGYIHDVGGPTANFRHLSCSKQKTEGVCTNRKCLVPKPCPNLDTDHTEYLNILQELRRLPFVKKVFIRSGIRYDYLMYDQKNTLLKEIIAHHVSGQLRIAPEHCVGHVLDLMGKPHIEVFLDFQKQFEKLTRQCGKEQYIVPYLMSSHPGCDLKDAVDLACFLHKYRLYPEQVQDFYPTPGTMSTCMFYTGLHPITLKPVYVPKGKEEKAMQRALMQYYLPENRSLVKKALKQIRRNDLIGSAKKCLLAE